MACSPFGIFHIENKKLSLITTSYLKAPSSITLHSPLWISIFLFNSSSQHNIYRILFFFPLAINNCNFNTNFFHLFMNLEFGFGNIYPTSHIVISHPILQSFQNCCLQKMSKGCPVSIHVNVWGILLAQMKSLSDRMTSSTVYTLVWAAQHQPSPTGSYLCRYVREKRKRQVAELTGFKNEINLFFKTGDKKWEEGERGKELICFWHWKTQIDSFLAIFVQPIYLGTFSRVAQNHWPNIARNGLY